MNGFNDDIMSLMRKRAVDMTVCTRRGISIYLDEEKINVKDFQA